MLLFTPLLHGVHCSCTLFPPALSDEKDFCALMILTRSAFWMRYYFPTNTFQFNSSHSGGCSKLIYPICIFSLSRISLWLGISSCMQAIASKWGCSAQSPDGGFPSSISLCGRRCIWRGCIAVLQDCQAGILPMLLAKCINNLVFQLPPPGSQWQMLCGTALDGSHCVEIHVWVSLLYGQRRFIQASH